MTFTEGQIFKGTISLTGGNDGPTMSWIVISPFNKMHIHSIDDPLDLHCWPLFSAEKGIEQGCLELVETDIDHPVLQLQREKEKLNISDGHLGLHGESLNEMLHLFERAAENGLSYEPYAAGEVLAFMDRAIHSKEKIKSIKSLLRQQLHAMESQPVT